LNLPGTSDVFRFFNIFFDKGDADAATGISDGFRLFSLVVAIAVAVVDSVNAPPPPPPLPPTTAADARFARAYALAATWADTRLPLFALVAPPLFLLTPSLLANAIVTAIVAAAVASDEDDADDDDNDDENKSDDDDDIVRDAAVRTEKPPSSSLSESSPPSMTEMETVAVPLMCTSLASPSPAIRAAKREAASAQRTSPSFTHTSGVIG
jgi:hypothetical protein